MNFFLKKIKKIKKVKKILDNSKRLEYCIFIKEERGENEMEKQETIKKMREVIKTRTIEQLKEMAKILMNDFQEGAGIVFNFTLDEIENRISEKEFVEFCDSL